jgi:hypothetical protein
MSEPLDKPNGLGSIPIRVDPDVPMTDIYLIPTRRNPDWTDEDVARHSAVIQNVRMPE